MYIQCKNSTKSEDCSSKRQIQPISFWQDWWKKERHKKKYGLSMTPRERFIPHCPGFCHNLRGTFHNVQNTWCPRWRRMCSHSWKPLRWHQPWLSNGTVHPPKEKRWNLHQNSEEDLGMAVPAIVAVENCCLWKARY